MIWTVILRLVLWTVGSTAWFVFVEMGRKGLNDPLPLYYLKCMLCAPVLLIALILGICVHGFNADH
jgi:hypothetical protein